MNREDIDMAYLAGIMDGDGSFSIIKLKTKANPLHYPFIQFVNRNKNIIDFLVANFGGNVLEAKKHVCKDGSLGNQCYRWNLRSSCNVKPALELLIPFLKIKKDRAEFLLEFIQNFNFVRGKVMPLDKVAERERYYLKMINFNDYTSFNNSISTKLAKNNLIDPIFWSYIAGLMDTDGSFSIKRQVQNKGTHVINARYLPVISLSMTDTRAINYLRSNCNLGKLYVPRNKSCKNGFHYQFGIYTKNECAEFLKRVIPYLKAKTINAEILLEFCLNSENTRYCKAGISSKELAFREDCYKRLIAENKYGVSKSSLIVLKTLPDNAEGNKEQAGDNAVQLERSKREDLEKPKAQEDAVL